MNDQELQDLIRLKRFEQPEEGYYESFLEEFHERRQEELLTNSARSLLLERVGVWFNQLGAIKWVAGAGLAYAAVAITLHVAQDQEPDAPRLAHETVEQPAVEQGADAEKVVPVSVAHSEPVSFSMARTPLVGETDQLF